MARASICEDDRAARSLGAVTTTIARLAVAGLVGTAVLVLWGGAASASDRPGLVAGLIDRVDGTLDPMLEPLTTPLEPVTDPVIAPVTSTADRVVAAVVAPVVAPLPSPAPSAPPTLRPTPTAPVPVPGSPELTGPSDPPAPSERPEPPVSDAVELDPETLGEPLEASDPASGPAPSPGAFSPTIAPDGPRIAPAADVGVDRPSAVEDRSTSATEDRHRGGFGWLPGRRSGDPGRRSLPGGRDLRQLHDAARFGARARRDRRTEATHRRHLFAPSSSECG